MEVCAVSAVHSLGTVSSGQAAGTVPPQTNPAPAKDAVEPAAEQNTAVIVSLSPLAAALYGTSNAP